MDSKIIKSRFNFVTFFKNHTIYLKTALTWVQVNIYFIRFEIVLQGDF